MNDLGLVLKALSFAAKKHRDQRRKDAEASPYINHPIDLANILVNEGNVQDATVIAAALLHDTVEDTECTHEELVQAFGEKIASVVREVTLDMAVPKPERKRQEIEHAQHFSPEATLVKLADKISNLRDLALSRPVRWPLERVQLYFDHAAEVIAPLRGTNAALELAFDKAMTGKPTE